MASSSRHLGRPANHAWPPDDGGWQQSARCRGLPSDVFFPEEQDSRRLRRVQEAAAKQICAGCPVIAACRERGSDERIAELIVG